MTLRERELRIDEMEEMDRVRTEEGYKCDFEIEFEQLIRKHLGQPEWNDYYEIARILTEVAGRLDDEAEQFPSLREILDEEAEKRRA